VLIHDSSCCSELSVDSWNANCKAWFCHYFYGEICFRALSTLNKSKQAQEYEALLQQTEQEFNLQTQTLMQELTRVSLVDLCLSLLCRFVSKVQRTDL